MSAASPRRRRRLVPAAAIALACFGLGLGAGALMPPVEEWPLVAGTEVAVATPAATPTAGSSAMPDPGASSLAAITAGAVPVEDRTPEIQVTTLDLDDPASFTVVVNKVRPLDPLDYVPADLVTMDAVPGGGTMRAEAAAAMTALYDAAVAEGAGFTVSTAYRSYDLQSSLHAGYSRSRGYDAADRFSARAGFSEHQTGLAADIRADGCDLEPCFADTAAGRYVAEHGWEHGFIVRYPADKEEVTGYIYEPWHLRYVGRPLAKAMRDSGAATMEEHFGLAFAPDYEP
ncbi:M15 family metallopeptidase [Demequina maris]|uniref:M15 family metallopeptidase n=1 Tax=Demequina maris TaxID=1638982 RepID=UPI0007848003|nr:M15 family metallopeptidase [Demequina maris]